jgi:hyperosmotically inducible protein
MKCPLALVAVALLAGCTNQQQQNAQSNAQQVMSAAPGAASDAYLTAAVATKLATVDVDSTAAVHVSVDHGIVTLSGQAHDLDERTRYEAAAKSVGGVAGVQDNLTVNPALKGVRSHVTDAALTARVSAAIAAQAGGNVFRVTPSVTDGVVTLKGSVATRSVHDTIVQTVRKLQGVRGVVDHIAIR